MTWFKQASLGCRILVKPVIESKTESGIIAVIDERRAVVDAHKGVVIAVGDKANPEFGQINVGDTVYYSKYGAKVVKHGNHPDELQNLYLVMNDQDVLLALQEGN